MAYYISKTSAQTNWNQLRQEVEKALSDQGFGILTEIDIQATMKKKLDKDYPRHLILGACNPGYADQVLQIDPHISTLLPCNVTLRERENGAFEVSAIDPVTSMEVVQNKEIKPAAEEVRQRLQKVLDRLA